MNNSPKDSPAKSRADSFEPKEAWCDDHMLHAKLKNEMIISVPLWWYPRLEKATLAQRNTLWLSPSGIHWDAIDEDIAIQGLREGWKAKDAVAPMMEAAE